MQRLSDLRDYADALDNEIRTLCRIRNHGRQTKYNNNVRARLRGLLAARREIAQQLVAIGKGV